MKKYLGSQRGAMFGLDARISLAIIAALSLVGGMTMFTTSSEVKAKALVKDIEAYKAAIDGMQYDMKTSLNDIVTPPTGSETLYEKVFMALNDKSLLKAQYQPRWLGPYIKTRMGGDITQTENYGKVQYFQAVRTSPLNLSCGGSCFNWIVIFDVPQKDFLVVNQIMDGDEATPASSGRVWWRADNGTTPDMLAVLIGKSL